MFDWIFFILASNNGMHNSLDGIEFQPDQTRELSALVLMIGSYSFLQVTRATIRSRMSSNFGQIRPWTAELDALERLKRSA